MPSQGVFTVIILLLFWVFATMAQDATKVPTVITAVHPKLNGTNRSVLNSTESSDNHGKKILKGFNVDSSMIQRALYVLIGITMIGVLYFIVRAVRLKKPTQRKKYGLLANYEDNVEMDAMESDEDETVYEARSLRG